MNLFMASFGLKFIPHVDRDKHLNQELNNPGEEIFSIESEHFCVSGST